MEKEKERCPECGGRIRYVFRYDRLYCDSCKKYVEKSRDGIRKKLENDIEKNRRNIDRLRRLKKWSKWGGSYNIYCCVGYWLYNFGDWCNEVSDS